MSIALWAVDCLDDLLCITCIPVLRDIPRRGVSVLTPGCLALSSKNTS